MERTYSIKTIRHYWRKQIPVIVLVCAIFTGIVYRLTAGHWPDFKSLVIITGIIVLLPSYWAYPIKMDE